MTRIEMDCNLKKLGQKREIFFEPENSLRVLRNSCMGKGNSTDRSEFMAISEVMGGMKLWDMGIPEKNSSYRICFS